MKSIQTLVLQQKAEPFGIRSSFIVTLIKHRRSTARLGVLLLDKARKHTFPGSPENHIYLGFKNSGSQGTAKAVKS